MKRATRFWPSVLLIFTLGFFLTEGCDKADTITQDPTPAGALPVVVTSQITAIEQISAIGGGNVTSDGGKEILMRGLCWSTQTMPTIEDDTARAGAGTGEFSCQLAGLTNHTKYFVRAFATNSVGTAYGDTVSFVSGTVKDVDGNLYHIISIDTQDWMVENLKVIHFNDSTPIQNATSTNWANIQVPAYCWYQNDEAAHKDPYGALYNWYAVNTGKLCPTGWHVPSREEWNALTGYLGGPAVAGGKLKEAGTAHWMTPNTGATNEVGFTAVPGGLRGAADGFIGKRAEWWTSSGSGDYAWPREIYYNSSAVTQIYSAAEFGFSVRCLRDE